MYHGSQNCKSVYLITDSTLPPSKKKAVKSLSTLTLINVNQNTSVNNWTNYFKAHIFIFSQGNFGLVPVFMQFVSNSVEMVCHYVL